MQSEGLGELHFPWADTSMLVWKHQPQLCGRRGNLGRAKHELFQHSPTGINGGSQDNATWLQKCPCSGEDVNAGSKDCKAPGACLVPRSHSPHCTCCFGRCVSRSQLHAGSAKCAEFNLESGPGARCLPAARANGPVGS